VDGRDRLVEEALAAVRGFLEDEDVAAGALGGADLRNKMWLWVSTCGRVCRRALYLRCMKK